VSVIATSVLPLSTLWKLIVGALAAGFGVTFAFSLLIYCAERASAMRRSDQRSAAMLYQAASVVAVLAVAAIVAYGLILTISKPK
jgi:ABC-type uncharacterized transport system YnjBCD ATPase subunit